MLCSFQYQLKLQNFFVFQHWDVFVHVSEVFIMVPALLGLKGNLEMTLASRLSTQVNWKQFNSDLSPNVLSRHLLSPNKF